MQTFHFHLRLPGHLERDEVGVPFDSLEDAYLDVCEALPAIAGDLMAEGHDVSRCVYLVAAPAEQTLLEVTFRELQRPPPRRSPAHWAEQRAASRVHVQRAREMAAAARQASAEARASLARCLATVSDMQQRGDERRRR